MEISIILKHFESNKTKQFKNIKDDISDYVRSKTPFLEESASYGQRLWHLKNNIFYNPVCGSCGKLSEWDRRKQRYFLYCCVECHNEGQKMAVEEKQPLDLNSLVLTEDLRLHLIDFAKRFNNSREKHDEYNIIAHFTSFLPEEVSFLQRVWHLKNNNYEIPKCENCGKEVSFSTNVKYNRFCCDECRLMFYRSDENKERIKNNWKEKYGVDNYSKTEKFKQERIELSAEKFKQKIIDCNLSDEIEYVSREGERSHLFLCKVCNNKFVITTSLFNYRFKNGHVICTDCNKERIKTKSNGEVELKNFIEQEYPGIYVSPSNKVIISPLEIDIYIPELKIGIEYNGDYWHANPKIYNPNETILYRKCSEIWEKDEIKKNMCDDKGINLIVIWESEWKKETELVKNKIKNIINQTIEYNNLKLSESNFLSGKDIIKPNKINIKISIESFLNKHGIEYVYKENNHKFIITDSSIIINLLYIEKTYKVNEIINSFKYYNSIGKNAYYIWNDLYSMNVDLYEKYLEKIFNINQSTIYARKCEIRKIENKTIVNDFCNLYHLQGKVGFTVAYGLYYNEELVEIMSFKTISKERDEWEISRLCSKSNVIVIGGANKLWKRFLKDINPLMCLTYSDISLFSGNVYRNMELMEEKNISEPNYWYTNGEIRLSRRQCQKDELMKYFPNYKHLSEVKIMTEKLGFHIIENCGNYKFVYERCQDSDL